MAFDSHRISDTITQKPETVIHADMRHLDSPRFIERIAHTLAEVRPDGVRVNLSPSDLGQITLSISESDKVSSVRVETDHPEVSDFLKRHENLLQTELKNIGFSNVNISFGSRSSNGSAQWYIPAFAEQESAPEVPVLARQIATSSNGTDSESLDIRI